MERFDRAQLLTQFLCIGTLKLSISFRYRLRHYRYNKILLARYRPDKYR